MPLRLAWKNHPRTDRVARCRPPPKRQCWERLFSRDSDKTQLPISALASLCCTLLQTSDSEQIVRQATGALIVPHDSPRLIPPDPIIQGVPPACRIDVPLCRLVQFGIHLE